VVALLAIFASFASANTLTVVTVHPGCVVEFDGEWRTRLTGVLVAEPESHLGRQATDYCTTKLEGELITLLSWNERDKNRISGVILDPDGMPFGRILYGPDHDRDIAAELLELGLARVDPAQLPTNLKHYHKIEQAAREARIGLWAEE
jgi:endonuclease YncB( thermonuclease family)